MRRLFFTLWAISLMPVNLWAHPASLGEYPERFPGKTLQKIRQEWEPESENAWNEADLQNEARSLVEGWTLLPGQERDSRINRLITENRRGEYRKRFANLAHDMADLAAADPTEASLYLTWRLDHLAEDDGFFDELVPGSWNEKPADRDERTRRWMEERDQEAAELVKRANAARPGLRPHWLIQAGALEFRHRRHSQAEKLFRQIVDDFPKHPRAEVAMLMLARLNYDQWRHEKRSYHTDGPKLLRHSKCLVGRLLNLSQGLSKG